MRYMEDPRQNELFDSFEQILSPTAYRRIKNGWQYLFRSSILKLMPAKKLAEHFHPEMGRPTKELYSIAALLFVMEFRNWTHAEAADAYMFNVDLQYALNLRPENQSLCRRTIERYIKIFREDDLAQSFMNDVTAELITRLELDVSKQRLDSTHVNSNMAKFGRIKLMATTIKRFLTQVLRHDEGSYNRLPKAMRERYEGSTNAVFGWKTLDDDGFDRLRQGVAEDLSFLVERYRRNKKHNTRSTFAMLVKVFEQQCDVIDQKVTVKKKTGGEIIVNPSDPDATFCGHKGPGYQVQLAETCSSANDVQLITVAEVETAVDSDSAAIAKVVDHYEQHGHQPDTLYADTAYGSDDNFEMCHRGRSWESFEDYRNCWEGQRLDSVIHLVSPVPGQSPGVANENKDDSKFGVADFEYDDQANRFTHCPAGHRLHRAHNKNAKHELIMLTDTCRGCPLLERCPMKPFYVEMRTLTVTAKQARLAQRRKRQQSEAFGEEYRIRSGIEGTNSGIKRVTGMGCLRVRGMSAVKMSVLLKVAGWNLLQAARKGLRGDSEDFLARLCRVRAAFQFELYESKYQGQRFLMAA